MIYAVVCIQISSKNFKVVHSMHLNQCIPVLYRPHASHQVCINSKYTILTCCDNNIGTLHSLDDGTYLPKHVVVESLLFMCTCCGVSVWYKKRIYLLTNSLIQEGSGPCNMLRCVPYRRVLYI